MVLRYPDADLRALLTPLRDALHDEAALDSGRTAIGRSMNHATPTPPRISMSRATIRTASHTGARPMIASVTKIDVINALSASGSTLTV